MTEEKQKCPKCGSDLLVRLGNQTHCNSCAHEFGLVRDPIAQRAARARAARCEKSGYQPHKDQR
jgi:hypothetical protein